MKQLKYFLAFSFRPILRMMSTEDNSTKGDRKMKNRVSLSLKKNLLDQNQRKKERSPRKNRVSPSLKKKLLDQNQRKKERSPRKNRVSPSLKKKLLDEKPRETYREKERSRNRVGLMVAENLPDLK